MFYYSYSQTLIGCATKRSDVKTNFQSNEGERKCQVSWSITDFYRRTPQNHYSLLPIERKLDTESYPKKGEKKKKKKMTNVKDKSDKMSSLSPRPLNDVDLRRERADYWIFHFFFLFLSPSTPLSLVLLKVTHRSFQKKTKRIPLLHWIFRLIRGAKMTKLQCHVFSFRFSILSALLIDESHTNVAKWKN